MAECSQFGSQGQIIDRQRTHKRGNANSGSARVEEAVGVQNTDRLPHGGERYSTRARMRPGYPIPTKNLISRARVRFGAAGYSQHVHVQNNNLH